MNEKPTMERVEEFSDWLEGWLQAKEKQAKDAEESLNSYQDDAKAQAEANRASLDYDQYVRNCLDALADYLEAEGCNLIDGIREMQEEIKRRRNAEQEMVNWLAEHKKAVLATIQVLEKGKLAQAQLILEKHLAKHTPKDNGAGGKLND